MYRGGGSHAIIHCICSFVLNFVTCCLEHFNALSAGQWSDLYKQGAQPDPLMQSFFTAAATIIAENYIVRRAQLDHHHA